MLKVRGRLMAVGVIAVAGMIAGGASATPANAASGCHQFCHSGTACCVVAEVKGLGCDEFSWGCWDTAC